MKSTFVESMRHKYPLTKDSVVFDVGGYKGEWSKIMYDKYRCQIYCFEPIFPIDNPNINIYKFGLGAYRRMEPAFIDMDKTGMFCKTGHPVLMDIVDILYFVNAYAITHIDLLKINIEGMEYELLKHLIESGWIENIDYVQVQFHNISTTSDRQMYEIQEQLKHTHHPQWQYRYVWESWKRNGTD